jgi:hypothetical protein
MDLEFFVETLAALFIGHRLEALKLQGIFWPQLALHAVKEGTELDDAIGQALLALILAVMGYEQIVRFGLAKLA